MKRFFIISIVLCMLKSAIAQVAPPAPLEPVPTLNQLKWQDMEMYAFIHY